MAARSTPTTNLLSGYSNFRGTNAPVVNDVAAGNLSNKLMAGFQPGKTLSNLVPQETLAQLGQVTKGLANYQPAKIDVTKVETMPVEYYQKQVEDLSAPIVQQYDKARATSRGDQAARGTIYDSEGYKDIGQLDKSYLEQLGSITRGTEIQRMQDEQAAARDYATRYDAEAADRRKLGLEGMTSAGSVLNTAVGTAGSTGAQLAGIDANAMNSLLGYGADRYGTEADLFGNIYNSDQDMNKTLITDRSENERARRQNIIDSIGLTGYQDFPQEQLLEAFSNEELGYDVGKLRDMKPGGSSYINPGTTNHGQPTRQQTIDGFIKQGYSPEEAKIKTDYFFSL
jgi:hypothetical protein